MSTQSKISNQVEQFVSVLAQCQQLGMGVVHATKNQLIMELPYNEFIIGNPDNGVIHGGAITTLMDTTAGCSTLCSLDGFELCPTLDLRVDYMRPACPDKTVYAKASCYRQTENIMFMRCEAYQEDRTIAQCVATFMRLGEVGIGPIEGIVNSYQPVEFDGPLPTANKENSLEAVLENALKDQDYRALFEVIPYAQFIGVDCQLEHGIPVYKLAERATNIGNPTLPAIHGGVIGGFMEMSAGVHLMMSQETPKFPKIIDFSLDYLRAGLKRPTFAQCEVTRQGSRVANVEVRAWQESRDKPIALARAHFLI